MDKVHPSGLLKPCQSARYITALLRTACDKYGGGQREVLNKHLKHMDRLSVKPVHILQNYHGAPPGGRAADKAADRPSYDYGCAFQNDDGVRVVRYAPAAHKIGKDPGKQRKIYAVVLRHLLGAIQCRLLYKVAP
ncbi:hypothetical protein SDC9_167958 [bioreactor metagenome]|uniref:Uncharacterized protein n=1 Tax=bioreactor metagenome TaxID=1076179 RepID=A0A645G447_9ZZZZ